ncbi:fibrinogen-like protein 1 [Saccostrea cucullata]|uniref:fibrinogen-like protein 1 n=1 Tax=Saccostrea cuccullata TaxID=36930 RepID=UPI002ED03EC3
MAGVLLAIFVYVLLFCAASCQKIYIDEKNYCNRNDQTIEILNDKIEYLRQENARQAESLKHENTRIAVNQKNIQEEFNELFNILMKNVTNIHEDLKSNILQTINEKIEYLRQENARQIESSKRENARQIESLKRENARQIDSLKQEIAQIKKNETNIHDDLKSSILETIKAELYKDCKKLYIHGNTESGVYEIYPFGIESKVSVFCDMMTEGGGWTAIQRRVSGSVSFDRNWTDYKTGFGNPNGSYWIGNDVIQQLTRGRNSSLYVSITLTNGTKLYELYNQFFVADEINKYRLFLGGQATGTLGDSMLHTGDSRFDLSGMSFSTPDRDNDRWIGRNCAAESNIRGGWWFNACNRAFLNGQWSPESWYRPWYPTVTESKQIKETLMMIKYN